MQGENYYWSRFQEADDNLRFRLKRKVKVSLYRNIFSSWLFFSVAVELTEFVRWLCNE